MSSQRSAVLAVILLGSAATMVPLASAAHEGGRMRMSQEMSGMDEMWGGERHAGFDFATFDSDGDGKITEAEFQAQRTARIEGLDADGDGLISQDELTQQLSARMADRIAEMAAARIKASDADGDGKLSAAELVAAPMAGRFFEMLDADGDGSVTKEEIAAARQSRADHHGWKGGEGRHKDSKGWFGWGHGASSDE